MLKQRHLFETLNFINRIVLFVGIIACTIDAADSIPGIGMIGNVGKIAGGFKFTEGPAFDGSQYLYFTDVQANRIYRWDAASKTPTAPEVFLDPAGTCNGLMLDGEGRLIACSMDGELLSIDTSTKQKTTLVGQNDGKRFNACNDLVIDKTGGVYFTDPRFKAPDPWPQGKEGVYYRSANGETKRIAEDFDAPNGIILSPDESRLYVIPSMDSKMIVFDVISPGVIENRRTFCELSQVAGQSNKGGDGLTIDTQGNLYITSALGLQVFAPDGNQLGTIALPEQPANVTFGGTDNSTLYATARTSLYAIPTGAKGHRFSGKVK